MSDYLCKGKGKNEIFCNCQFEEFILSDGTSQAVFNPIVLTTETIKVLERNCLVKVTTMVDLQISAATTGVFGVDYKVERITGNSVTTLCSFNVSDDRSGEFTLNPVNTVCDTPPTGIHVYQLSILDNKCIPTSLRLTNNCRCINVTTLKNMY
ncbi:hypothetical protein V1503_05020 [Bacillus sp. SCS-151]|uniref:hypothetical protein n=1 Tax=Nanhaiella sioensis TaxID=3115293 RepID=UPI00397C8C6F